MSSVGLWVCGGGEGRYREQEGEGEREEGKEEKREKGGSLVLGHAPSSSHCPLRTACILEGPGDWPGCFPKVAREPCVPLQPLDAAGPRRPNRPPH